MVTIKCQSGAREISIPSLNLVFVKYKAARILDFGAAP